MGSAGASGRSVRVCDVRRCVFTFRVFVPNLTNVIGVGCRLLIGCGRSCVCAQPHKCDWCWASTINWLRTRNPSPFYSMIVAMFVSSTRAAKKCRHFCNRQEVHCRVGRATEPEEHSVETKGICFGRYASTSPQHGWTMISPPRRIFPQCTASVP